MDSSSEIVGGLGVAKNTEEPKTIIDGLSEVPENIVQEETIGDLGVTLEDSPVIEVEEPLTGDWITIGLIGVKRPNPEFVSEDEAVNLLDEVFLKLRKVAGMKDELKKQFGDLSDKCIDLINKLKRGEMSAKEALSQLDGEKQNDDKIEER